MDIDTTISQQYTADAVALLSHLIATPSISREEGAAADLLEDAMQAWHLCQMRSGNNIWAVAEGYDSQRPTLLLNAHLDTVRPVASWTRDPFTPSLEGGLLYGLGSNDCGGGLVALLQVFRLLSRTPQCYNLIFLASAEEEVSGANGLSSVLAKLPAIHLAIVGEPTGMEPAVAEKGLMVIDMTSHGRSGHAARGEGENAIYKMLDDLLWLRDYRFDRVSDLLGPTLMNVTVVHSGTQHDMRPHQQYRIGTVDYRFETEDGSPFVRPRVIQRATDLRTGNFYRESDVQETYARLMRLGAVRSVNIRFAESEQDSTILRPQITLFPSKRNSFNEDSSFWTLPEDMKNIMIQLNLADDYFKARYRGEKLDRAMEAMKEAHAKELEEVREESRQELERALHQSQDDNILEIESLKKQLSEARTQLTGTQTIMKQLQASLQKEKTRATESEETLEKERAAIKDKEQRLSREVKNAQDSADRARAELAQRKALCELTAKEIDALTQSKARMDAVIARLQEVRGNF